MILYLKDPKTPQKNLLFTKKSIIKVAGYKLNFPKALIFSYNNNKQSEKEYRKIIPFTTASKNIKHLEISLTKDMKDLNKENHKSLKKEIKEDYRRWKDLPCSRIGRIGIMKMATL
jgi:hypothetical protein